MYFSLFETIVISRFKNQIQEYQLKILIFH